jgi:hypothetical protein
MEEQCKILKKKGWGEEAGNGDRKKMRRKGENE